MLEGVEVVVVCGLLVGLCCVELGCVGLVDVVGDGLVLG